MGEFSLPTNIRQIGSIGDGLRIYMEDYVFTYLHQYAEAGGYEERAAYLIGRHMVIDGQQVLFINGAVQGKEMETRDGLLFFTEKTGEYANAMIKEYFSGLEIVGWMQSQPSYGVYLNQQYGAYHRHVFSRDFQVMFVMDPQEKTNSFYAYNSEREAMQEIRGYFIFYDKNKNMHEYMLHDRATDKPAPPSAYVEVFGEHDAPGRAEEAGDDGAEPDYSRDTATRAEEMIRRRTDDRTRKRSAAAQRRAMNLMTGLSAALFIACFVMGAGLIQNRDEISSIKTQLSQLSTAYRNLFVQISSDGTSPVFAAEDDEPVYSLPSGTSGNGLTGLTAPAAPADDLTGYTEPGIDADGSIVLIEPETDDDGSVGLTEPEPTGDDQTGSVEEPPAGQADPFPVDASLADASVGTDAEGLPAEVTVDETNASAIPEAYTIQPGDSLLAISLEFYGNGNMVDEILALNGIINADRIVSGKTIALPRP